MTSTDLSTKILRSAAQHGLIGNSTCFRHLLQRSYQVAQRASTLLLTGETGSGKDLLARWIHACSPRHEGPFVRVDCGTLPSGLLENELFGHITGAFTGAHQSQRGLVEEAHKGTLFLDEVDSLPLELQSRLLHLLDDGTYRRIGHPQLRKADLRFLAATNHDLEHLVANHRFRSDLYYRLSVIPLHLPALRDRLEDIPDLVLHHRRRVAHRDGLSAPDLNPSLFPELMSRPWPGNIRELVNWVECSFDGPESGPMSPPPAILIQDPASLAAAKKRLVDSFERAYCIRTLRATSGNVTRAAQIAGKHRSDFHSLLRKHDLHSKDYRS